MTHQQPPFFTPPDFLDYSVAEKYAAFFEAVPAAGRPLCEMTRFENAFLMGLVRQHKPRKILEVGIAAGATSAMLLDCIAAHLPEAHLFSVDSSDTYYRGEAKTGFLAFDTPCAATRWTRMTGDVLPTYLEGIGHEIDVCILDTLHILPGELLDFIAVLPYLRNGAIVVLHDVALPFVSWYDPEKYDAHHKDSCATRVLLDVAVGEKILCRDASQSSGMVNIAAVRITDDTRRYVRDVFSALALPWAYMPPPQELDAYASHYEKHYSSELAAYFRLVAAAQQPLLAVPAEEKTQAAPLQQCAKRLCVGIKHVLPYGVVKIIQAARGKHL